MTYFIIFLGLFGLIPFIGMIVNHDAFYTTLGHGFIFLTQLILLIRQEKHFSDNRSKRKKV